MSRLSTVYRLSSVIRFSIASKKQSKCYSISWPEGRHCIKKRKRREEKNGEWWHPDKCQEHKSIFITKHVVLSLFVPLCSSRILSCIQSSWSLVPLSERLKITPIIQLSFVPILSASVKEIFSHTLVKSTPLWHIWQPPIKAEGIAALLHDILWKYSSLNRQSSMEWCLHCTTASLCQLVYQGFRIRPCFLGMSSVVWLNQSKLTDRQKTVSPIPPMCFSDFTPCWVGCQFVYVCVCVCHY